MRLKLRRHHINDLIKSKVNFEIVNTAISSQSSVWDINSTYINPEDDEHFIYEVEIDEMDPGFRLLYNYIGTKIGFTRLAFETVIEYVDHHHICDFLHDNYTGNKLLQFSIIGSYSISPVYKYSKRIFNIFFNQHKREILEGGKKIGYQ